MKPSQKNVMYMLKESNAIEGVYDQASLVAAKKAWDFITKFDKINNMIVKQTHKILMKPQTDIEHRYKGDFRDVPVMIGGEVKAQPKIVIDSLMRDWCNDVNTVDRNYDPVTLHILFESIHPFIDGNGRIGRILLNWHLVNRNKAPLLVYTEADKHTYYMLFPSYRARVHARMYEQVLNMPGLADKMRESYGQDNNDNHAGFESELPRRDLRKARDSKVRPNED